MDFSSSEKDFRDESEINIEMTQKIKKDPKFLNYIDWLRKNGAIFENVNEFIYKK